MKNTFLWLSMLLALLFTSCKKDMESPSPSVTNDPTWVSSIASSRSEVSNEFSTGNGVSETPTRKRTVLGDYRENPYTVQNFTAAYNDLYEPDISTVSTTHYYYKFQPSTLEQASTLAKSGLNLYDYPLEREVVEMGDYYEEPTTAGNQLLVYYAVVRVNESIPNVPSERIASLHLNSTDESLIRKALLRKGYDPDLVGYRVRSGTPEGSGSPSGDPGDGGQFESNSCGCKVFKEQRKPGGCVKVWDNTKVAYDGVRKVKIIIKDTWFTEDETWTDDNGCWRIDSKYYGKAWMWVRFISSWCQVRGATADMWRVVDWSVPVRHYVGKIGGPRFNNISVKYEVYTTNGSTAHLNWAAATVNNSLHDFHDVAKVQRITPPKMSLDIYIGRNNNYGFALMGQLAPGLVLSGYFGNPWAPLGTIPAWIIEGLLPDLYVGCNFRNSSTLKSLAYHEIAHASHFENAGPIFWIRLIAAEVAADGHGTAASVDAGVMSIAESWAEYFSYVCLISKYPNIAYTKLLEETRNEGMNHIPIGYYHDLTDYHSDDEFACDYSGTCGSIADDVAGFNNAQMYSLLTGTCTSPAIFTNRLIASFLPTTSNTKSQVDALFLSY